MKYIKNSTIGGSDDNTDTLILDEEIYEWNSQEFPALSTPRTKHACAVFYGEIYIMGGRNKENETGLTSVEILDLESKEMRSGPQLPFKVFDGIGLELEDELYLGQFSEL